MTVVGTASGHVLALRGLRELPDFGESNSALLRPWRVLRKRASRRWRARIVDGPVSDFAFSSALSNIFGRDHVSIVRRRNAGTIDPRTKSRGRNAVNPGVNVSLLLGQHASTLFLIEKNNGRAQKPLAPCRQGRGARV